MKTVTLRETVDILAEQGIEVKWDENLGLQDFFSYYDQHYKPALEVTASLPIKFLRDDILEIFE